MKNRTLVTALRQFNPELKVSLTAHLQYGCQEVGYGSGEYEGCAFSQDYTIGWNDGYLSADKWEGYTVQDLIDVLLEKTLSKINNGDFSLRPGELRNGNPEYTTTWDDEQPEDDYDDSDLYNIMEIGDANYEFDGPASLEIDVHYIDQEGEDATISFELSEDETDRKPDPLAPKADKKKAVKKAAKKK